MAHACLTLAEHSVSRIAILADIHGNVLALDAVLADVERRGVDLTVDLGDAAHGSLDPAGAIARLRDADIPSIRGNTDRLILSVDPPPAARRDYAFARSVLGPADLEWLAGQPTSRRLDEVFLFHATPSSDTTVLLETVTTEGVRLATDREITERLVGAEGATVIATAHSHVPRAVRTADGRLCVNPGSVGLPAYEHDQPLPHAMEAGSPHARYAVIEHRRGFWHVEHHCVWYDWEAAARQAEDRERPDRAYWLRTGRGRPPEAR
jgi:predicted phosphodiesterase